MARQYEYYRDFEEFDYERLAWEREQEQAEQEELEYLNNHKKSTDHEFKKSNPLQSEDQIRA